MATIIPLKDENGNAVVAQAGESSEAGCSFTFRGATISKASLLTLVMTLYDFDTNTIINGRDGVNVLDANGGEVSSDGRWTQHITPLDNVIVSPGANRETHVIRLTRTWSDGSTTKTGIDELSFPVERLATVTAP